jgi:hypothetical protein
MLQGMTSTSPAVQQLINDSTLARAFEVAIFPALGGQDRPES